MKKGINRFGIKLEDFSDYASYKRALKQATDKHFKKTPKGILKEARYYLNNRKKILKKQSDFEKTKKGRRLKNARNMKRHAAKLQRTPAWADLEAIRQFYLNCPKGYEVDHDVPLQGVNISGLHVLNNLVYLTKSDNRKKSNKWPHNYSAQNGFSSNLAIV